MFDTFKNAWKIEDLRKRILFTLMVLVVFRLGCAIPVPFVNTALLQTVASSSGNLIGYINMLSGGAFSRAMLFALGVSPYINSSIIIQLLTVVIPALERLSKEGEDGRKKLQRITRYVGAGIALALSIAYYFLLRNWGVLVYTEGASAVFSAVVMIFAFTAGSMFVQWMGEQIDVKGIGNGISILIFAGIISSWSSLFTSVRYYFGLAMDGESKYFIFMPLILVLALVVLVLIVILNAAERRIPVQYAKRVVGRKMYGGQNTPHSHQGEYERRNAHHFCLYAGHDPYHHCTVLPQPLQCICASGVECDSGGVQPLELGLCRHLFCAHHRVQLLLCGNSV